MSRVRVPGVGWVNFPASMDSSAVRIAMGKLAQPPVDAEAAGYDAGAASVRAGRGIPPGADPGSIKALTPQVDMRARAAEALSYLRPVGSALGGLLAGGAALETGPGALLSGAGGAALGSAGGRTLELAGLHALGYQDPSLPQAALNVAGAGGVGALEQLGGNVLGAGMRGLAGPTMERALRMSTIGKATSPAALKGYADTALKHRIPVGGMRKLGSEKLVEKARLSGQELQKVLGLAHNAGAQVDPARVADNVVNLMDDVLDEPLGLDTRKALYNKLVRFAETHKGPLTPMAAKRLKTKAWELAMPILNKAGKVRPGSVASDALAARFNYAIAKGAQQALEDIKTPISRAAQRQIGTTLKTYGQAIGEREAKTSRMLGLLKPLERAESATSKVTISPFGPLRPLGSATPLIRLSRPTMSRIALGLSNPTAMGAARQLPRAGSTLLEQLGYQTPQDTTDPVLEERMRRMGLAQGGTP